MMTEQQSLRELIERWDIFLEKIEVRFNDAIAAAAPSLLNIVEQEVKDTQPFLVAWQAVRSQLLHLIHKIGDTWQETVSPQMEALGYSDNTIGYDWLQESSKGTMLENKLHHELSRQEIIINGQAAEIYYRKVMEQISLQFRCHQCAAPLKVAENIFRAHYHNCPYCNTVNTYEPATGVRNIEWFALNRLAAYRCLAAWDEKAILQNITQTYDPRSAAYHEYCKKYQAAVRVYYEQYLQERISIMPELAASYEQDLARSINNN